MWGVFIHSYGLYYRFNPHLVSWTERTSAEQILGSRPLVLLLLLCSPICRVHIVPECTLAGHRPFHWGLFMPTTMWPSWHFVCDWPPQPQSTAAIFSGLRLATKTLGRKKWDMKKENKQHDWWPSLIVFSATPEWMIADYLRLSVRLRNNCPVCAYLTGDMSFNCLFEANLQPSPPPCQKTKCFFHRRREGRCNYFAMFA